MRFIALVRGINVGGKNAVAMSDLREMLTELGFIDVKTLLQSGNLVFAATGQSSEELERLLETEAESLLNIRLDFILRDAKEWQEIVAANPFRKEAVGDPAHLAVMCLKKAPTNEELEILEQSIVGRETIRCIKRQLYIVYPDGIGRSKLTHATIEKKLNTRGTARNWNTVLKIAQLLSKMEHGSLVSESPIATRRRHLPRSANASILSKRN